MGLMQLIDIYVFFYVYVICRSPACYMPLFPIYYAVVSYLLCRDMLCTMPQGLERGFGGGHQQLVHSFSTGYIQHMHMRGGTHEC
jgi:hypothetical protein